MTTTIGATGVGAASAQAGNSFIIGNRYAVSAAGSLAGVLRAYMQGSTTALADQTFRPVVYNAPVTVPDTSWTLISCGAELSIAALSAAALRSFAGLAGILPITTIFFGLWTGPLAGGTGFALPFYDAPGGTLGYYAQMAYSSTLNPTSPFPQSGTFGTENKVYNALNIDENPPAGAGLLSLLRGGF